MVTRGSLSMDLYKKKTKMELQRSVRQLKEENAVYARMNIELREKYNQVCIIPGIHFNNSFTLIVSGTKS